MKAKLILVLLTWSIKALSQDLGFLSGNDAVDDYFRFYRTALRDGLGSSCSMYPSCSSYSSLAIKEKGLFKGSLLTADRLMRCGHDLSFYSSIIQRSGKRVFVDFPDENRNNRDLIFTSEFSIASFDTLGGNLDVYFTNLYDREFYMELITQYHYFESTRLNDISDLIKYYYLKSLVKVGDSDLALKEISRLSDSTLNYLMYMPLKGDIHLSMGLATLAREDYSKIILSKDFEDSCSFSNRIALTHFMEYDWAKGAKRLCGDEVMIRKSRSIVDNAINAKAKSPTVAAFLGIIPGLGYLYTEKPKAALTSFCFNGLMMFASYDLVRREEYGMAALCGFFTVNFYLGNIVGSYRSAKDRKRKLNEQYYRALYSIIY